MNKKTAIVVGATGGTGKHLVKQLLDHESYQQVVVLARRALDFEHQKLSVHVIDFDQTDSWRDFVRGDELFSALGTTLKLAGSKRAQYKVDYGYQLAAATAARQNGVNKIVLVSSPNANAKSLSFYLKMKGELDDAVGELEFEKCVLIKPSIIEAERPEGRPGEKIAGALMKQFFVRIGPLRKYRPISGEQLATAMINIAQEPFAENLAEIELGDLFNYL